MNKVLILALLLTLAAWGAAQFVHAYVLYLAVRAGSEVRRPADLGCWVDRRGIALQAGGSLRSPYGHTVLFEVDRPRWNLPSNPPPGFLDVYIPFWQATLVPTILLAWRWWMSRRRRRPAAFEVQPAKP
jgi:hypothetical protein